MDKPTIGSWADIFDIDVFGYPKKAQWYWAGCTPAVAKHDWPGMAGGGEVWILRPKPARTEPQTVAEIDAEIERLKTLRHTRHDLRNDLQNLIRYAMNRKGWNQRDLAKASGVSPATICDTLSAKENITLDTMGKLLHALGCRCVLTEA